MGMPASIVATSNPPRVTSPYRWTAAVLLVSSPFLVVLCLILWRTPFPLTEAVAIFEDIERAEPLELLVPDTSYYRPLFT